MKSNEVPARLKETICNNEWVKNNEDEIRDILPDTWTHVDNISALQLGFNLKLIGIDWQSEYELLEVMIFLEHIGIMQKDGHLVRRNNSSIF